MSLKLGAGWCLLVIGVLTSKSIPSRLVRVTPATGLKERVSDPLVGLTRPDSESRVQASALKTMFMDVVSNGNRFYINHVLRKHPALSVRT